MQVICTDGTVLQCQRFEAIDSGVLLFGEQPPRGEEDATTEDDEEEREEAMAFVPLHQLRFVLPEGIQPRGGAAQAPGQPQPGVGAPTGGPPQGQAPPQGMGEQQPQPGGQGPYTGQQR